jgi:5'-3' exonuclease
MSNLELVTDATVVAKYSVLPSQYADYATMRGDASDGLPGVAGIGEKSAATLLAAHGDLEGIMAAAAAGDGLSASVRAKLTAALDYLAVAPTVVRVVTDLDLGEIASQLHPIEGDDRAHAEALAAKWGLGTSMARALDAFATR